MRPFVGSPGQGVRLGPSLGAIPERYWTRGPKTGVQFRAPKRAQNRGPKMGPKRGPKMGTKSWCCGTGISYSKKCLFLEMGTSRCPDTLSRTLGGIGQIGHF